EPIDPSGKPMGTPMMGGGAASESSGIVDAGVDGMLATPPSGASGQPLSSLVRGARGTPAPTVLLASQPASPGAPPTGAPPPSGAPAQPAPTQPAPTQPQPSPTQPQPSPTQPQPPTTQPMPPPGSPPTGTPAPGSPATGTPAPGSPPTGTP